MRDSIHKRRREIADYICRTLDGEHVVVTTPDHPLVMRPVDVLVGGKSGITAVVIPTADELKRSKLLHTRLTLNRLALPPESKFILIDAQPDLFDRSAEKPTVLASDDPELNRQIVSIISHPKPFNMHAGIERDRELAVRRFADTYRVARVAQRFRRPHDIPYVRSSGRPARDILPGGIDGAFFDFKPETRDVVNLYIDGVERWFTPDGDEPTGNPAGLALAPDYPRVPGDPDKIIRASAFAGWVFAPLYSSRSRDVVGDMVARYARLK
ncbi:MAG TPA: hypothetical protein VM620_09735 [Hyphomicrobium sp.]|nr:hypothetical protein [Hyphomicrobium sp.]